MIVEGESLELECDFEADPIPDIRWTKDAASVGHNVQVMVPSVVSVCFSFNL